MGSKLSGIHEKLKRADEQIINLDVEINDFLKKGEYSKVIANGDAKTLKKAIAYHRKREIPERFNVLVGEIFYQFRSSLDHLACQLAGGIGCDKTEFPIYKDDPARNKNIASTYQRKIERFTDVSVKTLIESMQPYKAPCPMDHPLSIIHDMNIIDKHRELVLVATSTSHERTIQFPFQSLDTIMDTITVKYGATKKTPHPIGLTIPARAGIPFRLSDAIRDHPSVNVQSQVTLQISFPKFGLSRNQPIVPSLQQLSSVVWSVVESLSGFLCTGLHLGKTPYILE